MKKYLISIILILLGLITLLWIDSLHTVKRWKIAEANVKAYSTELSASNNKNTALQLTIEQLGYFNDSILERLDSTRKALKIKDKNLKAVQYIASGFTKNDTIRIIQKDTLFKDPSLSVDTLVGDSWYSLDIKLRYPSTVITTPYFKSEKHVIVSYKKETVNPPKKFFLLRWFQKKHKILNIEVVEKNPYVEQESSKYIEIIK